MPANECAAVMCGRACQRAHLMCKRHWYQVPPHLRAAILRLYAESGTRSPAYWVARGLAVREVSLAEGVGPSEEKREEMLAEWRSTRDRVRRDLGSQYGPVIAPLVLRLKKLMDEAAAGCPLEACEIAMRVDQRRDRDHNARRIAAALDLSEAAKDGEQK